MNKLHPGVKWSFRIGAYITLIILSFFISWFIFVPLIGILGFVFGADQFLAYVIGFLIFGSFYIIGIIIIAEIYTNLAYKNWLYEFGEDNLKIERGIIWKKYSNIPYERVQNVDITRGIIARMLGFSSVNIQTAGYSYSPNGVPISEGFIPAVDLNEAEQIREYLMKKITKKGRNQGL